MLPNDRVLLGQGNGVESRQILHVERGKLIVRPASELKETARDGSIRDSVARTLHTLMDMPIKYASHSAPCSD